MIDAKRITEIVKDCLFRDDEVIDGKPTTDPVLVSGVVIRIGFHKERLESHREEVKAMLSELPLDFQPNGGGGSSFLNMCMDKFGNQWGEHRNMDELCALAIGLGLGGFPMGREFWSALPGGVPYFSIVETTESHDCSACGKCCP